MKTRLNSLLTLSLTLTLSACSSHMNDPNIKQNPTPKMRYDVMIAIDGAPGPFDSVGGFMQYEVTNKACVPETGGPMNAMRLAPMSNPPIVFTKASDNVYKGTVYADYFQDEDHFGLGVCHWSLMAIITELKINKLTINPDFSPEQLFLQEPVSTYFLNDDYADNKTERSSFGYSHEYDYKPELRNQIFSIALLAKERAP